MSGDWRTLQTLLFLMIRIQRSPTMVIPGIHSTLVIHQTWAPSLTHLKSTTVHGMVRSSTSRRVAFSDHSNMSYPFTDGSLTSDAVSPVSLDFPFTGTGLTVYCILWHLQSGITPYQNGSITSLSFTIDGQPAGNYTSGPYTSYASTTYDYNVPVYNSTSISNGQHTFSMALQPNTVAFFDYAVVYQTEQPVKKKAPVGAIVGSIIGVLLLFVVLSLIIRCLVRRRRRRD
ncbi:hypothetical protein FRB94_002198 [Tulasnella sp. JGI-2019a]|nr:hypothetical protein FRB94_002198 [Tulasnella sp. JGI-2019a]